MFKLVGLFLVIFYYLVLDVHSQQYGSCYTPHGQIGSCIPLTSCSILHNLFMKPLFNHEDRNLINQSQCGGPNQSLVCCPGNQHINGGGSGGNSGTGLLPEPGVCGIQTADKIVGGQIAAPGEFPWMALLEYQKPYNQRDFHCGGNLINERYVLTASHCINGNAIPTTWILDSVRLGELDTTTDPDCQVNERRQQICAPNALDIPIAQKIPHESYVPTKKNQENDIGLLRLQRSVQYNDYVRPICLPTSQALKNVNYEGYALFAAGWGKTEDVQSSTKLLKATLDGYSFNRCSNKYITSGVHLTDTQLCAGGRRGVDTCNGDSGGPLMTMDTSTRVHFWYLAGVVSFGPRYCGSEDQPGVYTRIDAYISWIESKLRP